MAKYQKYTEYKDSGVEWLGEIPSHWDFSCLKYLLDKMVAGGTPESTNDAYWAESGDGIPWVSIADITKNFEITATKKDVTELGLSVKNLQILPKNTILYSIFASLGKVSSAQVPLVTNQAILGLIPKVSKLDNRYLVRWLQAIESNLAIFSTSNTQDNLNAEKVGNLPLFNPPLNEQRSIANFLEHETAQIDTLIAKQEKLIELLKEKRQAVISHAVTKGLNPDVTMKDSGVEWLGQVPEHWATTKLKYVVKQIVDAEHKTAPYFDDGQYLVCRTTNVRDGKLRLEGGKYTNHQTYNEWTQRATPEVGDILFTREAPAGEACVYEGNIPLCLGQRMVLFKLNKEVILPEFLLYSLYSGLADNFIKQLSQGSTVTHFNMADIQNIPLFELPKDEQKQIVRYLRNKLNEFQNLEDKAHKAIQLMQERRTALISSAVTGKIDVRNWRHPNEAKTEFGA